MIQVLVFPSGSGISQEIHNALSSLKGVSLVGADSDSLISSFVYESVHKVPPMKSELSCVHAIRALVLKFNISFIYPALDDALVFLKTNEEFMGVQVIASPLNTVLVTRSKSQTYKALENIIRVPIVYDRNNPPDQYPVFVKPDSGEGSKRCRVIKDSYEFLRTVEEDEIVVEYFPGEEYSVDCFSKDGLLLFVGPRVRLVTKSGVSVVTVSVPCTEEFMAFAHGIHKTFEFKGAWFFQVKRDQSGTLGLLEVAPRIAGASACHRAMGVNLPLLTLETFRQQKVLVPHQRLAITACKIYETRIRPNIVYYHAYFDLDDTLYRNGTADPVVLALAHKIKNTGKPVYLITRHNMNPRLTLEHIHVRHSLFNDIIHVTDGGSKKRFIKPNSIFFDDSFYERESCSDSAQNIHAFDVDAAKLFLLS